MRDTTAHQYSLEEVRAALARLMRMGMARDRAIQLMLDGFPEFRDDLLDA